MIRRLFARPGAKPDAVAQVAPDERIYAIGDIHGRHDLLIAMLDRIAEDAETREDARAVKLVFLGDYIDRGDDSRAVLAHLHGFQQRAGRHAVFLMGNHEAALLAFLRNPERGKSWLEFGALQTLGSFGIPPPGRDADADALVATRDALRAALGEQIGFLRGLDLYTRSGGVVFTHAGVNPDLPLARQEETDLLWGHPEFLQRPAPGLRVVHGHFAAPEPVALPGRICVDTGAYYTGCLTAVRLDAGEEFISVRAGGY